MNVSDQPLATSRWQLWAADSGTAEGMHQIPSASDWVLVLGDGDDAGHWRLGDLTADSSYFAFDGQVFETGIVEGELAVSATPRVVSRVSRTFVRKSDTVVDLEIRYDDGSEGTVTGTPEHPFYVPALSKYVPLGQLDGGTRLHTEGSSGAVVVGSTWRQGDYTVFNFEVEGPHNYFVRAPGSDSAAVLVHNTCPGAIRFIQASITDSFKDGRSVSHLIDGLVDGSIDPTSVPAIRVFKEDGKLYTLDNRRLYAFQEAAKERPGLQIQTREVDAAMYKREIDNKRDTRNDGESVVVYTTSD